MKSGTMHEAGEVLLAEIQFADTFETKKRPAVVLFEDFGNIVVAGMTSNTSMKGIPVSKKEGALKDCIIKTNYIFTISEKAVEKSLFRIGKEKRLLLYSELEKSLNGLK